MKMTAPQSLKFSKLKRRLGLPHWQAVGLLESLWLFTQVNAPAGDVGRHSDEDIAAGIEWDGETEILFESLIECGWLDRCEKNRLVVHDWEEHVPRYLKGALVKNGVAFATVTPKQKETEPKQPAKPRKQAAKPDKQPAPRLGLARQVNSNVGEAIPLAAPAAVEEAKTRPRDELFDSVAEVTGTDPKTAGGLIGKVCKALRAGEPPYTPEDVKSFAARFGEFCPWGPKDGRLRPTPNELQTHIGKIRAKPPPESAALTPATNQPAKSFSRQNIDDSFALLDSMTAKTPAITQGNSDAA